MTQDEKNKNVDSAVTIETIQSISEVANRAFEAFHKMEWVDSDLFALTLIQGRVKILVEKEFGPDRSPITEATDLSAGLNKIVQAFTWERMHISEIILALSLQSASLTGDVVRDHLRTGRAISRTVVTESIGNMLLFMFSLCNIYHLDLGTILQKTVEMAEVEVQL